MRTAEERIEPRLVYDFEVCHGTEELKLTLSKVNSFRFVIVAMTESSGIYTVVFQRPAP